MRAATVLLVTGLFTSAAAHASSCTPSLLDPNLQVSVVVPSGITQPIGIVFLSADDFFVLEKASGRVKRVTGGVVQPSPVLDLGVNSSVERGLYSMVLDPAFSTNHRVYISWAESSTGSDSTGLLEVPLLGNRVDRFVWNGSTLALDLNLIKLRALQTDNVVVSGQTGTQNAAPHAIHNGGVLKFGPDGKLYLFVGDVGRRGWMQNLSNGPFQPPSVDDTFGGPGPDNAHLTGVVLRLNTDGTAPADNPFYAAGSAIGGEVGASIQKVYSYGHRNGFGMAFDPLSGSLWATEDGDDSYSELNRVTPGMDGGWVQTAGPSSRVANFKLIETTQYDLALDQVRYLPSRIADTPGSALSAMFLLPGAQYRDPELSWKYDIAPAGAAFVNGNTLGSEYAGTLWIGSARSFEQVGLNGGSLYRLNPTQDRLQIDVSADPRLADKVADNLAKFDGTESETLLIGSGFGVTPDIEQGPDGNLYVVSYSANAIYRVCRLCLTNLRGDVTNDGAISVSDVFFLINRLFAGGAAPPSACRADVNGSSTVDALDVFFLINYLFACGPPPFPTTCAS